MKLYYKYIVLSLCTALVTLLICGITMPVAADTADALIEDPTIFVATPSESFEWQVYSEVFDIEATVSPTPKASTLSDTPSPESHTRKSIKKQSTPEVLWADERSSVAFGDTITLMSVIYDPFDMEFSVVWQRDDGNGYYNVGTGTEYTFYLTPESYKAKYRFYLNCREAEDEENH